MKLFNHSTDDDEYTNNERQCLIKMFAVGFLFFYLKENENLFF